MPLELLRQQRCRTNLCTLTTADTGNFLLNRCNFFAGRCKNTVGGFGERYIGMRERKAHHGAAHNQTRQALIRMIMIGFQQMADGGAYQCPNISGLFKCGSCQRHESLNQGLSVNNGALNRINRTNILYHQPDIGWQFICRDFKIGQYLNELFFTPGRIFGRDDPNHNTFADCCGFQGVNCFWFIVFDTNNNQLRG